MKKRKPQNPFGFTADHLTDLRPPIPYDSDAAISAAAASLCELKRSSSLNNSINLRLSNHPQEAEIEATNDEQMIGFENGFGDEEETEEKVEEKKGQGRKRREKGAMIKCNKTDGKGWHCKLRSYRSRFDDQISGDHRKKFSFPGGSASNYYYYYSILGPWWGKRRGPVNEILQGNEENGISSKDCNVKSADCEAAVDFDTVDDEEEEEEEEEEEDDDDDYGESYSKVTYLQKKKNTKRMIKRKGRKSVKARSLKSLL